MHHRLLSVVVVATALIPNAANAAGCPVPGFNQAAFGDTNIDMGNGNTDSYDSQLGNYAATNCATLAPCVGGVATNGTGGGALTLGPNGNVDGQCTIGAGGLTSDIGRPGNCDATGVEGSALALPLPTAPGTATALGAISGSTTIATAGDYTASSISLSGNASLDVTAGPVVLYLTGSGNVLSLTGNGAINNNTLLPSNLVIMCTSSAAQTIDVSGNGNAFFAIYCPKADITIAGNGTIFGAIVGKSVSFNGNNGFVHYDKALASFGSTGLTCGSEVSRATPIVASLAGTPYIFQGTYEAATSPATTIATVADVATFTFPHIQGHMRARLASSVTTSASGFSAGNILFDAAAAIPTAQIAGCALGANAQFTTSCRNVFTNTTGSTGTTTFTGTPANRIKLFDTSDANAGAIGPLIAPAGNGANQVPGIALAQWKTIVSRVLAGTANGTVAKLGGVDRSTVAVIEPSNIAGVNTRPTMTYFGGTDGMLHAVCSTTGGVTATSNNVCGATAGTELWAFVPRVQLPLIRVNKQRIDGSVRVVDAFGTWPDPTTGAVGTTKTFRTILTFQTGFTESSAGSVPAVYALDVTDPAKPILLWEYTAPSITGAQLGTGLAMHAGPVITLGQIFNLAFAETNNGGNGGVGVVTNGLLLETGVSKWSNPFSYIYAGPRPSTNTYDGAIPATGVPGGAVGVDLTGGGFTTHIVQGDLFGNLWKIDAATGTGIRIFSFASDRHPIGGIPAILDNGTKVAVFASGAYDDPSGAASWTTTGQRLIGVKLSATTTVDETSGTLSFSKALLDVNEKVSAQVSVVGSKVFITTDTSDINAATYGSLSATTGNAYSFDATSGSNSITLVNQLQGGASGLAYNAATSTLVGGAADKTQQLAGTQAASGTSVDFSNQPKTTRLAWLRTQL